MIEFKDYLTKRGYQNKYVVRINAIIVQFEKWCNASKINHKTANYNELMLYVESLQQNGNKANTISQKVKSIQNYYNFIERAENPAIQIKLRGQLHKIPNHILDESELMEIYALQHTKGLVGKRDKVLFSLIVFQGVIGKELEIIELKDVDLMEAKIYIPSTRTTNSRTLDLKPQQLLLFQDYITNIRRDILKTYNRESDKLLITMGVSVNNKERLQNVINEIRNRIKPYYPKFKTMKQLRQSVITNWLNQHGLRQTQYMAGHRYVSSTERYNVEKDEALKMEIEKHFPI